MTMNHPADDEEVPSIVMQDRQRLRELKINGLELQLQRQKQEVARAKEKLNRLISARPSLSGEAAQVGR